MTEESLFHQYFELIKQWNKHINLTAIRDEESFNIKHVEDSLALLPYIGDAHRILDLGTGAGIPGIILKVARSNLEVMLIDSTRKKISFCEEAIRRLGIQGITAVWARAEDPAIARSVGSFDLVISRATWELSEFLDISIGYISKGGRCISMKGAFWRKELESAAVKIKKTGLTLEGTHPYSLSDGSKRCILVFSKE